MIEGNGDIASVLKSVDRPDRLFFARGVSNSRETRESEYDRDIETLMAQDKSKQLVYFSSLAVFYSDTRYTRHKLEAEYLIKENFPSYAIVRLGNIAWGDNPHTLINFIKNKQAARQPYEIKNEYRYVIEEDEFLHWMDLIPDWNVEMNCPGKRMKVAEIVKQYGLRERVLR